MSGARRPSHLFLIALLAAVAAGCGSAASTGDRITGVPVPSFGKSGAVDLKLEAATKAIRDAGLTQTQIDGVVPWQPRKRRPPIRCASSSTSRA